MNLFSRVSLKLLYRILEALVSVKQTLGGYKAVLGIFCYVLPAKCLMDLRVLCMKAMGQQEGQQKGRCDRKTSGRTTERQERQ